MGIEKGCALEIVGRSGQESELDCCNSENLSRFLQLWSELFLDARDEHEEARGVKWVMRRVEGQSQEILWLVSFGDSISSVTTTGWKILAPPPFCTKSI